MSTELFEITELALKILSCIYRTEQKYGASLIAQTLCGSRSKRIAEFELDKLSTYGIVKDFSISQVQAVTHYLMYIGYIKRSFEHKNLEFTPKGIHFLKTRDPVYIPKRTIDEAKVDLFSKHLLPTQLSTLALWERGKTIKEIASIRKLKETTIAEHLADLVYHHKIIDISSVVSVDKQRQIRESFSKYEDVSLRKIKEQLPEDFSYGEIKIVLAQKNLNIQ